MTDKNGRHRRVVFVNDALFIELKEVLRKPYLSFSNFVELAMEDFLDKLYKEEEMPDDAKRDIPISSPAAVADARNGAHDNPSDSKADDTQGHGVVPSELPTREGSTTKDDTQGPVGDARTGEKEEVARPAAKSPIDIVAKQRYDADSVFGKRKWRK